MSTHGDAFDEVLGESAAAEAIRDFGRRAARVDAPALLTGESGTGKGLLARLIHADSDRARGPFVAVNCAGVPESLFESEFFGHSRGAFTGAQHAHRGLLEQADGGTLFLDEVGELAPSLQAKLLTALEDGEFRRLGGERVVRVDSRLIAATSTDLDHEVARGAFRRDLYHRLLVLAFRLPALRDRDSDVDLFMRHALTRFSARYARSGLRLDAAAGARLRSLSWPGNIRELTHAIEAAVLACDGACIEMRHLPASLFTTSSVLTAPIPDAVPRVRRRYSFHGTPAEERRQIHDALRRCDGNKTRAAADLGMTRNTLRSKLREAASAPQNGGVHEIVET